MKKTALLCSLITLVIISISIWEPSNFRKGSIIYYIKINRDIWSEEIFNPISEPLYTFRKSDGIKPEITIVNYCSHSSVKGITAKLNKKQYACDQNTDFDGVVCTHINYKYNITSVITNGKNCSDVYTSYAEIQ